MEHIPQVFWLIPIASVCALGMAWYFFKSMMQAEEGTPRMVEIAEYVRRGAMAYLKQQYKVVLIVFVVLAVVFAIMAYGFNAQNEWVPFAFLTGGFFSGLAGFFGMKTATYASARTANAARSGLNDGLKIAFRSGAVMGLVVVGLGLLDIAIWFIVLTWFYSDKMTTSEMLITITTTMLTFGMGASTQALFARVGGGIYTKAADVGADLVGKVEANIPEDDPRNPATIADNVGDNVGDVAGMGADLYESYCGSILSTAASELQVRYNEVVESGLFGMPVRPEQYLKAGQLNAMGIIDEIFHYMCRLYRRDVQVDFFVDGYAFVQDALEKEQLPDLDDLLLHRLLRKLFAYAPASQNGAHASNTGTHEIHRLSDFGRYGLRKKRRCFSRSSPHAPREKIDDTLAG